VKSLENDMRSPAVLTEAEATVSTVSDPWWVYLGDFDKILETSPSLKCMNVGCWSWCGTEKESLRFFDTTGDAGPFVLLLLLFPPLGCLCESSLSCLSSLLPLLSSLFPSSEAINAFRRACPTLSFALSVPMKLHLAVYGFILRKPVPEGELSCISFTISDMMCPLEIFESALVYRGTFSLMRPRKRLFPAGSERKRIDKKRIESKRYPAFEFQKPQIIGEVHGCLMNLLP
jgi:hypothetical protein